MTSDNTYRHLPWAPLTLAMLAIAGFLAEPLSSEYLAYTRDGIRDWQLWRFISANMLHTNFHHLALNLAGLTLLWLLHKHHYTGRVFSLLLLFCCLTTTLGIWFFSPGLAWYVGLSGCLHGLFVWGAIQDIRCGQRSGWLLFVGVWAKILYEQFFGASQQVASLINANVAIEAHLFGACGGMLFALLALARRQKKALQ